VPVVLTPEALFSTRGAGDTLALRATVLRTEEGGRKNPVFSGYRPQFYYEGEDWDAEHTYIGVEHVNLGDTVTAQLRFLKPQNKAGRIAVGMEFEIREGKRTVATGRVTEILKLEGNAASIPPK